MNEHTQRGTENIEQAVRDLTGIGRIWARHGLKAGQAALDASAQTLRATASALGRLSNEFEASAPTPGTAAAEPIDVTAASAQEVGPEAEQDGEDTGKVASVGDEPGLASLEIPS
jgi:hypothetical protein